MPGTFLLAGGKLPDAFEVNVRGHMELPQATIELHDYNFGRPQRARFESAHSFLDLALSHRPGTPRGSYVGAPGRGARPLGDVIFIPANHGLQSEWGAGRQSSVCCAFGDLAYGEPDDWTPDWLDASLDVRSPFVRNAMLCLATELETPGFGSELMAEALCLQISVELARYFHGPKARFNETQCRLRPAELRKIEEILEKPGKQASISELAAECGFSSRHFFRIFRATTGMTLSEFAANRKIERAKALLSARKPAIKEIAWRCGFETAAAFSVAFRRGTNLTPRAYRAARIG